MWGYILFAGLILLLVFPGHLKKVFAGFGTAAGGTSQGIVSALKKMFGHVSWKFVGRTLVILAVVWEGVFMLLAFGIIPRPHGVLTWVPDWGTPSFATVGTWAWDNYPVLVSFGALIAFIGLVSRWMGVKEDGKRLIQVTLLLVFFLFIFAPVVGWVQEGYHSLTSVSTANAGPAPYRTDVTNVIVLTSDWSPPVTAAPTHLDGTWQFCYAYPTGEPAPQSKQIGTNTFQYRSVNGTERMWYRLVNVATPSECPDSL